jgi:hypothetical protein
MKYLLVHREWKDGQFQSVIGGIVESEKSAEVLSRTPTNYLYELDFVRLRLRKNNDIEERHTKEK